MQRNRADRCRRATGREDLVKLELFQFEDGREQLADLIREVGVLSGVLLDRRTFPLPTARDELLRELAEIVLLRGFRHPMAFPKMSTVSPASPSAV